LAFALQRGLDRLLVHNIVLEIFIVVVPLLMVAVLQNFFLQSIIFANMMCGGEVAAEIEKACENARITEAKAESEAKSIWHVCLVRSP
jgi:hypothetical protein